MPPCVTSAMSVGNLSQQVRENGDGPANSSSSPSNNNNRVSSAVSVGNVSKIQGTKVTGELSPQRLGGFRPQQQNTIPLITTTINAVRKKRGVVNISSFKFRSGRP